jgi:hypothetical protein
MRSTYSRRAEAQPNVIIDQRNAIRKLAVTSAQPHSKQDHRTNWWGRITYTAVLLSSLFLGILAWRSLDLNNPDIPDWKPVLALADTAQKKGDLYYARSLYLQAGSHAARREDWQGLIAAACAMSKLDKQKGRYSPTSGLLLRAMIAAETTQSRSGMIAVAKAFAGLGEDKVASMVLSRIQKDWTENATDLAHILSSGCGATS